MPTSLIIIIKPANGISSTDVEDIFVDVIYRHSIAGGSATGAEPPTSVKDTVRMSLDKKLRGRVELIDLVPDTDITVYFTRSNGLTRLHKTLSAAASPGAILISQPQTIITLSRTDVELIITPDHMPPPSKIQIQRRAYFVPIGEPFLFEGY